MTVPTVQIDLGSILPARARRGVYVTYGIIALVAAGIDVGYEAAGVADPTWLTVAARIIAYLAIPVTALAVVNVPSGNVVDGNPATEVPSWGTTNAEREAAED